MQENSYEIVYGVNFCKNGHALRNKSGHCVMCKTAYLTFAKRKYSKGYVYVAISEKEALIKIGLSKDYRYREGRLNTKPAYGNINDWKMVFVIKADNMAGAIEHTIHKLFSHSQVNRTYLKEGRIVACQEIFNANIFEIINRMKEYNLEIVLNNETKIKTFSMKQQASSNADSFKEVELKPNTKKEYIKNFKILQGTNLKEKDENSIDTGISKNEKDILQEKLKIREFERLQAHKRIIKEKIKYENHKRSKLERKLAKERIKADRILQLAQEQEKQQLVLQQIEKEKEESIQVEELFLNYTEDREKSYKLEEVLDKILEFIVNIYIILNLIGFVLMGLFLVFFIIFIMVRIMK